MGAARALCTAKPSHMSAWVQQRCGCCLAGTLPGDRACSSAGLLTAAACAQVVEAMRHGATPLAAAEQAIGRIAARVPGYMGALVAVNPQGRHAGAAFGCAAAQMHTCVPVPLAHGFPATHGQALCACIC